MLRLRYLSWLVICTILLSVAAPVLPAHAAPSFATLAPIRQDEVADYIADIRSEDADIEDDFSRNSGLWDTPFEGTTSVYYRSSELRIAVEEENTLAWSMLDAEVHDFYVEVDSIHREGTLDNQFGFLFRFDEANNYYLFAVSSDGYYSLQLNNNGEWAPIIDWEESDAIEIGEGAVNTLGLLAEGDSFTLLINDFIIDEASDDTLSGTGLALNAGVFAEPPIELGFDNFRLWNLDEPVEEPVRQAPVRIPSRTVTATPEAESTPTALAPDEPTPVPTEEPTEEPTAEPTEEPTVEATPEPTEEPTVEPTAEPTAEVTEAITGTAPSDIITAIQAETPLYSADFSDETTDLIFFESDTVTYEVVDGQLEFAFNTANVLTWAELPEAPTHYYVEVDATLASATEAAEYGIIFNYEDNQNFYLFAINNLNRFSVWQLANNSWEEVQPWGDTTALQSGQDNTNRIGLLMRDESYLLVANGEVLAEIENDAPPSGSVALAAGTFDEVDLVMHFDNVSLWDLDESSIELGTPVATEEATEEATAEPTEEPTAEPTAEPTDEAANQDFSEVTQRIEEIVAGDPDISDDFRRDNGAWDTVPHEHGSYFYEGRAFNIEAYTEERIIWSVYYGDPDAELAVDFTDFYVEFDTSFVTLTGENAAGIVFRLYDTDNFYKFVVDEIGYFQLQKRVEGEYSDLVAWTLSDVADDSEGAVNRIGVLAEGSTIALSINGTVVAQVDDADVEFGTLALAVETYSTPEAHSIFDNFNLWRLNE
ncbi:MAG: PT domain-containing protein [Caldilineaceae bacterium]|nr:PT domain-containing protein [Caldilineaceae bacterium]